MIIANVSVCKGLFVCNIKKSFLMLRRGSGTQSSGLICVSRGIISGVWVKREHYSGSDANTLLAESNSRDIFVC